VGRQKEGKKGSRLRGRAGGLEGGREGAEGGSARRECLHSSRSYRGIVSDIGLERNRGAERET
jgi:hypothetical protein